MPDIHHIELQTADGKWEPVWGTATSSLLEAYGYCAVFTKDGISPLRVNPEYEAQEKAARRWGVRDRI